MIRLIRWFPNALSISRMPLTSFAFIAAIEQRWWTGLVLLIGAVATDLIDGPIARALKVQSEWGKKYIDPFNDGYMGFVSMLSLALQPDGTVWRYFLPMSGALTIVLKILKHAESMPRFARFSIAVLPLCYTGTMTAILMAYAVRVQQDDSWVWWTLVIAGPPVVYFKWSRLQDWMNGHL